MNKYKLIDKEVKDLVKIVTKNAIIVGRNRDKKDLKSKTRFVFASKKIVESSAISAALSLYDSNQIKIHYAFNSDFSNYLLNILNDRQINIEEFFNRVENWDLKSYAMIGFYFDLDEKIKEKEDDLDYIRECYIEYFDKCSKKEYNAYFESLDEYKIEAINEFVGQIYEKHIMPKVTDEKMPALILDGIVDTVIKKH